MNDLLDAAIAYAAMGWHIFPCKPLQKVPATLHGVKDATTDPDKIRAWWNRWPEANIGLACGEASGVYVVDVDVDEAKELNGFASMAAKWACQSEGEKACAKILDKLANAPDQTMMHYKLADAMKWDSKTFTGHITTLLEREAISIFYVPSRGGRPGKAYTLGGEE